MPDVYPLPTAGPYEDITQWVPLLLGAIDSDLDRDSSWDEADQSEARQLVGDLIAFISELPEMLNGLVPIGSVIAFSGGVLPEGWLWCDGAEYASADYPALVAAMDDFFSEVGFSTFNVPDLREKFIYGAQFPGALGDTGGFGGTASETLSISQLPAHTHGMQHTHGYYGRTNATAFGTTNRAAMAGPAGGSTQQTTLDASAANTGPVGEGAAHNNLPPYLKLGYIIRAL